VRRDSGRDAYHQKLALRLRQRFDLYEDVRIGAVVNVEPKTVLIKTAYAVDRFGSRLFSICHP